MKIVTFNIRYKWSQGDGINSFIHRAGMILDKIDNEEPDIICFQETVPEIRDFLNKHLTDYVLLWHGRDENSDGEGLAIAFRRDTMSLHGYECFWLSPTPYIPGSRYDGQSDCPRICVTAILKHKNTGTTFAVYNVHLDHVSETARLLGIRQVMDRVTEDNDKFGFPALIMGDFNATPGSAPIVFCNNYEPFPITDVSSGTGITFHGIDNYSDSNDVDIKIDYIYTDKVTASKVKSVVLWEDNMNGIYLSDHYPVCTEFDIQ